MKHLKSPRKEAMMDDYKLRLTEIEELLIEQSENEFILTEEGEGEAKISVVLSRPSLLLCKIDRWKFSWLKRKKCADYAVLEKHDGYWVLHIFELKKTVDLKEWMRMCEQFAGAYLRAEAVAGFVRVTISGVKVYPCYRNDKFGSSSDTICLRVANTDRQQRETISAWNTGKANIGVFAGVPCEIVKFRLDGNNSGRLCL
jgi:hypothetical protein